MRTVNKVILVGHLAADPESSETKTGIRVTFPYEKEGERKYITEVRADEVNMLTWKKKGGIEKVSLDSIPVD